MTPTEIQRMFNICKGCQRLDKVSGECTVYMSGKMPHIVMSWGLCYFNKPEEEISPERKREGQQKTKRVGG